LRSVRFDIYLPIYYNERDAAGNRIEVEKAKLLDTFKELRNRFGGISAEEHRIIGSWLDDAGIVNDDENTVYHIVCDLTRENMQWLSNYQDLLTDRFRQKEIFMYYIHVYRLKSH